MQEKLKCVPVFESHNGEVSRNFMLGTSLVDKSNTRCICINFYVHVCFIQHWRRTTYFEQKCEYHELI